MCIIGLQPMRVPSSNRRSNRCNGVPRTAPSAPTRTGTWPSSDPRAHESPTSTADPWRGRGSRRTRPSIRCAHAAATHTRAPRSGPRVASAPTATCRPNARWSVCELRSRRRTPWPRRRGSTDMSLVQRHPAQRRLRRVRRRSRALPRWTLLVVRAPTGSHPPTLPRRSAATRDGGVDRRDRNDATSQQRAHLDQTTARP